MLKAGGFTEGQIVGVGQTIAGFSGTVFGALVAALAIITAVVDRPLMVNMRKTGHWDVLVHNTIVTCGVMLLAAAFSVVAMLMDYPYRLYVLALAVTSVVSGVGMLVQLAYRYRQVIKFI